MIEVPAAYPSSTFARSTSRAGAFLDDASIQELLHVAYDALRSHGYTLWVWETGTDTVAGWMTLSRDDEAMRVIAPALGIELRPAGLA